MLYLSQVILYSAIMLLIYGIFLRNRPLYQYSRYYLLASAILPLLIPLIRIPEQVQRRVQNVAPLHLDIPVIAVNTASKVVETRNSIPWLWVVYGIVAILFITWQIWNGYKLWRVIRNNKKEEHGAYSLITTSGYGPGSFGRYIFFPGEEVNQTILAHEEAHIRLHHTRDIVLLNLLQAVIWPNLFLLWIKKELKEVHEFQADTFIKSDKEDYAQLLLCSVFNTGAVPIMHSFSIHPVKRRIKMLYKNGTTSPYKTALLVSASIGLFLFAALCIQSCNKHKDAKPDDELAGYKPIIRFDTVKMHNPDGIRSSKMPVEIEIDTPDIQGPKNTTASYKLKSGVLYVKYSEKNPQNRDEHFRDSVQAITDAQPDAKGIYTRVSIMPQPTTDPAKFIMANLPDPSKSMKVGADGFSVAGMVVTRFVIDENGNVTNPEILKSPDAALSEKMLDRIKQMPIWIPGEQNGKKVPVYYTMHMILASMKKQ